MQSAIRDKRTRRFWPWPGLLAASLAVGILGALACLGLQLVHPLPINLLPVDPFPIDLLHAAFFNGCTLRTYQVHWQDQRRYPDPFPFGMATSPKSVAVFVLWIENGPAISLSRELPLRCTDLNR